MGARPRRPHKVFERLVAVNHRGEDYDYDVSSIMTALYTGWDWREHTPEEEGG